MLSTFNFNFDHAYSWRHPFSIWTTQTNLDTYSKPDYVRSLINKWLKYKHIYPYRSDVIIL